jgi:hypothetical protein
VAVRSLIEADANPETAAGVYWWSLSSFQATASDGMDFPTVASPLG